MQVWVIEFEDSQGLHSRLWTVHSSKELAAKEIQQVINEEKTLYGNVDVFYVQEVDKAHRISWQKYHKYIDSDGWEARLDERIIARPIEMDKVDEDSSNGPPF